MKLNADSILERADNLYARAKTKHIPIEDLAYWAPERFPKIQSEQVKCAIQAIVEAINSLSLPACASEGQQQDNSKPTANT